MRREERTDGIWASCAKCNQMYLAITPDCSDFYREYLESHLETAICPECAQRAADERERREAEEKRQRYLAALPEIIEKSGMPIGYRIHRATGSEILKPIKPGIYGWIWQNWNRNLLLSGETGTGKSTSAVFAGCQLIKRYRKVRYCKLRKLLSEWREARTSDASYADEAFFNRIRKLDVLILDEVIGKAKVTESGQDMMFELLDQIGDGEIPKTRVWMLGNFRPGSIVELFGDCDPVLRRLQENFLCGEAKFNDTVEQFDVWSGESPR